MAVVIAKRATAVPAARAMEYVFGYCHFIDGSARGLLPTGNTFYHMKSPTHGAFALKLFDRP